MFISGEYKKAFYLAVLLHILLIALLILPSLQASKGGQPVAHISPKAIKIVKTKTVSSKDVLAEVKAIKDRDLAIKVAKERAIALANKKRAEAKAKAIALKKAAIKSERLKELAKQLKDIQLKQQQDRKKQQELLAKKLQKQKQEQVELQERQEQNIQQKAQNQLVVDQYKSKIAGTIGQYWLVSRDMDPSLQCKFVIRLAPGGVVLDVTLQQGSGNDAFDRSAKTAVYKASPLPVPQDSALFDQFREFSLIVSPKNVVLRSAAI